MSAKNLLIFPAGTEIAFEILNALKYSKFVNIIGGTSVSDHSEFVYDTLVEGIPFVNESGFVDFLNKVIDEYKIDSIYPAHDSVSMFLSEHSDDINAEIISSGYDTVKICRSKNDTYKFFEGQAFIPKTYESADEVREYPVFVKPSVGQGSNGAQIIKSCSELEAALMNDPSLVICEYLPGTEYTVDCFTDRYGNLRVVKMRDRERIRAGISVRSTEIETDEQIMKIADIINSQLNFRGAWFFQVKKKKNGEYRLMEISPRIPGTMGLSRNMGINFPMLTLFDFWGYDVNIIDNGYDIMLDRAFYNAYKINIDYNHIYVDFDDTLIVNGKVNKKLLTVLYQASENGKVIHLLSKHLTDIYEDLAKAKISERLFDEIRVIAPEDEKIKYITEKSSIFIDDSFAERYSVMNNLHIPVFDVDMVESLMDWREY